MRAIHQACIFYSPSYVAALRLWDGFLDIMDLARCGYFGDCLVQAILDLMYIPASVPTFSLSWYFCTAKYQRMKYVPSSEWSLTFGPGAIDGVADAWRIVNKWLSSGVYFVHKRAIEHLLITVFFFVFAV